MGDERQEDSTGNNEDYSNRPTDVDAVGPKLGASSEAADNASDSNQDQSEANAASHNYEDPRYDEDQCHDKHNRRRPNLRILSSHASELGLGG